MWLKPTLEIWNSIVGFIRLDSTIVVINFCGVFLPRFLVENKIVLVLSRLEREVYASHWKNSYALKSSFFFFLSPDSLGERLIPLMLCVVQENFIHDENRTSFLTLNRSLSLMWIQQDLIPLHQPRGFENLYL